jgi:UDP-2,4-diacetamido-2,4,6-trideoxy-beta-L-altropyranose hydrolase
MAGPMRFLFRADASTAIGSGHVTRCASLAHALAAAGHEVHFACRALAGDLNRWLEAESFQVHEIHGVADAAMTESVDADATKNAVPALRYDWLIVDHYKLGVAWERAMAAVADRILVIDDLGRRHDCHLLLDQNYENPTHAQYADIEPASGELLLGPQFALLGPQFAALRPASLRRRREAISRVVVSMGGGDPFNETGKVLAGLSQLPQQHLYIDVAIGAANPHRSSVEAACAGLRRATLHVQTSDMAELMAAADCAICGAGNITWERCALGLPGLATIMADNQASAAAAVAAAGAHQLLGWHHDLAAEDYARALLAFDSAKLRRMSAAAADICDGGGVTRVAARLCANEDRTGRSLRTLHA